MSLFLVQAEHCKKCPIWLQAVTCQSKVEEKGAPSRRCSFKKVLLQGGASRDGLLLVFKALGQLLASAKEIVNFCKLTVYTFTLANFHSFFPGIISRNTLGQMFGLF